MPPYEQPRGCLFPLSSRNRVERRMCNGRRWSTVYTEIMNRRVIKVSVIGQGAGRFGGARFRPGIIVLFENLNIVLFIYFFFSMEK